VNTPLCILEDDEGPTQWAPSNALRNDDGTPLRNDNGDFILNE